MAINVSLAQLSTLNNTSILSQTNANNAIIQSALPDALSRSGQSPNQMLSNLDMNSNQIINLPPPSTTNSPARLVDVTGTTLNVGFPSLIGDVTAPSNNGALTTTVANVSAAGSIKATAMPALTGDITTTAGTVATTLVTGNAGNLNSGTLLAARLPALTGDVTTTVGTVATTIAANAVTGAKIATNTVGNTNIRQGVARSIIGVTGNATANVADIQGTTRQVLSINTAGTAAAFAQPQGDQLLGTTTNDNATAGNVGEFISSVVNSGSALTFTSNTAANITSISLTAGDWDVWGSICLNVAATTNMFNAQVSVSTTSATMNLTPGQCFLMFWVPGVLGTSTPMYSTPPVRVSLSGTTTVFAVGQIGFTTSTCTVFGGIFARRVR
jgi:hypothetical protein